MADQPRYIEMKTSDNYFVGFPAIWNVVALYVYVLDPPKMTTLAVTIVLVVIG
mgnify:CR=1 FL=1